MTDNLFMQGRTWVSACAVSALPLFRRRFRSERDSFRRYWVLSAEIHVVRVK